MPPHKLLRMKIGKKGIIAHAVGSSDYLFYESAKEGSLMFCVADWDGIGSNGQPVWRTYGNNAFNYYRHNLGSYRVDVFIFSTSDKTAILQALLTVAEANASDRELSSLLYAAAGVPRKTAVLNEMAENAASQMSVEKAKKVTVALSQKSFEPPPRRINDILEVLNQSYPPVDHIREKNKAEANASPPNTEDPAILANFYLRRGHFARELGRYKQNLEDLRMALSFAEDKNGKMEPQLSRKKYALILTQVAHAEGLAGNLIRAINLLEKSLDVHPRALTYVLLAYLYWEMGNFQSTEKTLKAAIKFCSQRLSYRRLSSRARNSLEYKRANMLAKSLENKGQYSEAEVYRRVTVAKLASNLEQEKAAFKSYINHRENLALNLASQGRLVEAEMEARGALREAIRHTGKLSGATGEMLGTFGQILLRQGRLSEAQKIFQEVIRIFEKLEFSENSFEMIAARKNLANTLALKLNYSEAMQQFDYINAHLAESPYFSKKFMERNPLSMLCLLETGRIGEAMDSVSNAYHTCSNYLGEKHTLTSAFLGLRAMVHARMKANHQAMQDFSKAVPSLLQKTTGRGDTYIIKHLFGVIIDAYMDLLFKIHEQNRSRKFNINPPSEIFKLCQAINYSTVQSALGASGARAAAVDPFLADLVRREQDASKQINELENALSNVIAIPTDQRGADVVQEIKSTVDTLNNARAALLAEIKRRFPKYADFDDPQTATLSDVQMNLRAAEALVMLYPGEKRTYVWAIPHTGNVRFASASLNRNDITAIVARLRKSLDPKPDTLGDIPDFDLGQAYIIYSKLLKPVRPGWKNATDLLIVAPGPLGQLPFSVLPTSSATPVKEGDVLFSSYRNVSWLIRQVALTRLPSVHSLITLRSLPAGDSARKAFCAFGDPCFNQAQLARLQSESNKPGAGRYGREVNLSVRGIRLTAGNYLDNQKLVSARLESLNRLPDTAEELKNIASALDADPNRDVFLGKDASESRVKAMDLSDRRIIAFASHALVPGDLDGLDQPAIALSSPSVTGENEDGLLKVDEILEFKLNADWVVLSACNTGAADGAGAEAISGLGSAFFYAGTRAILISMWPVETTAAKKLTTGLFQYQQKNIALSRSRALQQSILDLMNSPGLKDSASGKIVASYAHPLFWAPFIVVGENRAAFK
ncbi:MAG: CHAT domain-containing protein [Desulfobacterales bacterium]